jgi:hypothetical protein
VFVYRGPYSTGSVPLAPDQHGRYAVIVARARHPEIVGIALADHLPAGVAR